MDGPSNEHANCHEFDHRYHEESNLKFAAYREMFRWSEVYIPTVNVSTGNALMLPISRPLWSFEIHLLPHEPIGSTSGKENPVERQLHYI